MDSFLILLGQITANERFQVQVPPYADMAQHPYGWLSLVPPIAAIVLAILTRRILFSLTASIVIGALILGYYSADTNGPSGAASGMVWLSSGIQDAWHDHLWPTLLDPDKVSVFLFTCLMGAIVGMVNRSAGMRGLIGLMIPITRSPMGVQVATWFSGMLVFFDDYANTMLLGTTYRSIYDRFKISREKLAYIVDSTAAPVAGLAIVSTWIASELQYINDGLTKVTFIGDAAQVNPFMLFIESIPYRFYVLWALFFVLLTSVLRRDFGPMLKAERRCRSEDSVSAVDEYPLPEDLDWKRLPVSNEIIPVEMTEVIAVAKDPTMAPSGTPARSLNAILPILVTVVAILTFMYQSGLAEAVALQAPLRKLDADGMPLNQVSLWQSLGTIFGNSNSFGSLVWGSLLGCFFTFAWIQWQRIVPTPALLQAAGRGAAHMVPALAILWLASTLSAMTGDKPTQPYRAEQERARQIARTIAGIERVEQDFEKWNQWQRVHEILRLHKVSDPVVIEVMVGHFNDPDLFRRQIADRVLDPRVDSSFYSRYLMSGGQQVDWDKAVEPAVLPPPVDPSEVEPSSIFDLPPGFRRPDSWPPGVGQDADQRADADEGDDAKVAEEQQEADQQGESRDERADDSQRDAVADGDDNVHADGAGDGVPDADRSAASDQENGTEPLVDEQKQVETRQQDEAASTVPPPGGRAAGPRPGGGQAGGGPGGGGPAGGAAGGGGGGGGDSMAAMFADRQADPSMDDVWESLEDGLEFPYSDFRHRLHTGRYLTGLLARTIDPVDPAAGLQQHPFAKWLPTVIFILAGFTAFATGTSWGTMGIIMPLAIPLAAGMLNLSGGPIDPGSPIFLATIAGVLAGAIFGDHCSPISDTTVLSSNASGCSHLAHVWTQMPYALTVAAVTILFGTIPVGWDVPWWVCLPVGTVVLVVVVLLVGRSAELPPDAPTTK